MINMCQLVGSHDILLMTLDTLRFDVAQTCITDGRTPFLASLLPDGIWEERHSPATFTYAAHQAFFAGFLPTPITPGQHPRLFAAQFPGSETTHATTYVFDAPDIVTGLAQVGYRTLCIGGVGFFNQLSPLGQALPSLFMDRYWTPALGVTDPQSTAHQIELAVTCLQRIPTEQRVFLFVNISALHQPNYMYLPGATSDSWASHAASLAYVDRQLPPLFAALQQRASTLCILCSDHGTAYGEAGYVGHRVSHPVVWTVPYAEFVLPERQP